MPATAGIQVFFGFSVLVKDACRVRRNDQRKGRLLVDEFRIPRRKGHPVADTIFFDLRGRLAVGFSRCLNLGRFA